MPDWCDRAMHALVKLFVRIFHCARARCSFCTSFSRWRRMRQVRHAMKRRQCARVFDIAYHARMYMIVSLAARGAGKKR